MDAKRYLVGQGRLSALAADAEGYLVHLDKMQGAHDKVSVPNDLG